VGVEDSDRIDVESKGIHIAPAIERRIHIRRKFEVFVCNRPVNVVPKRLAQKHLRGDANCAGSATLVFARGRAECVNGFDTMRLYLSSIC